MRRLFLTMLLATSVATPALAQRGDREGGGSRDGSSERARPHRAAPAAQQAPRAEAAPPARQTPVVMRGRAEGPARGEVNNGFRGNPQSGPRAIDPAAVQQWRDRRAGGNRGQVAPVATTPPGATLEGRPTNWNDRTRTVDGRGSGWTRTGDGRTSPVVSGTDRRRGDSSWDGTRDGRDGRWTGTRDGRDGRWTGTRDGRDGRDGRWRDGRGGDSRWSNDWRRDRRYDWRDYRARNSSIFRLGRYNDPFGYGYQRLSIGFTLFPGYYQSNYWLDDPYQYRLPPVYGPYRWVRYYDDAVLVDIYTGEVVDVIQGFFW